MSGFRFRIIAVVSSESDDSPTTCTPVIFSRRFLSLSRKWASASARDDGHLMVPTECN